MTTGLTDPHPRIFSTCPTLADTKGRSHRDAVAEVARWSEERGCTGMLIYADNRKLDPWAVAQVVLENSETLSPLPAVQPVYSHPLTVAKRIASLGQLFGRRVFLNMVAGGFRNDLIAMGDPTEHDRRYDRLREYVEIVLGLLEGRSVTLKGEFYDVKNLIMEPGLPDGLEPGILLSGSSEAGRAAARALGATAIKYPKPAREEMSATEALAPGMPIGMRVGIIARETEAEAWRVARGRFPEDREGQLAHQLAMKASDSVWHRQLSELAENDLVENSPYWLVPFENYRTMCPYLVGSYETVALEVARYLTARHETFILDIPPTKEALEHQGIVFEEAVKLVGTPAVAGAP